MKYFLVFLVVFLVAWRWRTSRDAQHAARAKRRAEATSQPVEMVVCAHCGVHLPANEALQGTGGNYCSQSHRQARET